MRKRDFSKTTYKTKKNYELKKKNVNKESNEKLKIISQARKDGNAPKFGDIRGTEEQPKKTESNKSTQTNNNSSNNGESNKDNQNKVVKNNKLKIKATNKGGPVKDGVEYARSKGDDLAGYRRTKDTRITKKLKKAGFTEDRLARLRKDHAEWKANRKKKKKK